MYVAALLINVVCWADAAPLQIHSDKDVTRVKVVARLDAGALKNIPAGAVDQTVGRKYLKLCLIDDDGSLGPPILGKYVRRGDMLVWTPRFGLIHGQRYRAILTAPAGKRVSRDYRVPPRKVSGKPTVEQIYPSGDLLPANHLKFYIHFSKPMREGRAIFDLIQLVDDRGKLVADAWRRTELWTADAKRFTLWIHPGRVKQGVNLREEFGPVLHPGKRFSLVIDAKLQDADGVPLGKPYIKKFLTTKADYHRPLPQLWKRTVPAAGTRDPVRLEFGEPLDQAMLKRLITVHDSGTRPVTGETSLGNDETIWEFRPKLPWKAEEFRIVVDELLEDLAGNTPVRVFDTDLQQRRGRPPVLTLRFQPSRP